MVDDVTDHELVPEHTLLDESEVEDVLDEYDIGRTDLPKIKRRDPALPDDAEPGDVVKIVRDSRTTDKAIVYRLVIE
ncbi:DNA-directed RNA polymerase subunit H [Halospeciosus flavus]|uniref:DNA-directed RNA polymerase subunit Rpo5 n=1 Tax=Halospeciosus flavus TaxID=3032283 RepID=A0ABD5Z6H3_9EURY|nr:DNA-directed RNA polymerase subunit H [Halospeciosus flavus]